MVISQEPAKEATMQAIPIPQTLVECDIDDAPVARAAAALVLSTAEVASCTCPEWCERDHDRD
jgi:hypothetical protein